MALIRDRCLKAHESGRWPGEVQAGNRDCVPNVTWATPASLCRRAIEARIAKEGVLADLSETLSRLRTLRPKGAAEKIPKASSQKIRVIPANAELETWLTIPGDLRTKTSRHFALLVQAGWLLLLPDQPVPLLKRRSEQREVPDGLGAAGAASSVLISPWPRECWR
ncbi:MAG: hypothetical protein VKJ66_05855 [Synechococcus sp.]|nr:hypothetical protein [Synechococcus sp.]